MTHPRPTTAQPAPPQQQARQLAFHGWDHPDLLTMLEAPSTPAALGATAAAGDAAGGGGDGAAGVEGDEADDEGGDDDEGERADKPSRLEPRSLLKLRLAFLDAHSLEDAYLQLAMRGRMWSEVVARLLGSKDRCVVRLEGVLLLVCSVWLLFVHTAQHTVHDTTPQPPPPAGPSCSRQSSCSPSTSSRCPSASPT